MPIHRSVLPALALLMALARPAAADPAVEALATRVRAEAASLVREPAVLDALRAANRAHAGLDAAAVERLDAQWRREVAAGGGPLIAATLAASASARLRARKEEPGAGIADLFVFDLRGLNVAQSWVTHDYWQGDEPQFLNTIPRGAGAANVESLEPANPLYDGPVRAASTTLVDPATGGVIGGLTVVFRASADPGADERGD